MRIEEVCRHTGMKPTSARTIRLTFGISLPKRKHCKHSRPEAKNRLYDCVKCIFECGLGTNNPDLPSNMGVNGKPGASLRVWKDYFPNATIYGADIDKDVLFEEPRIKTYYVDQLDPESISDMWEEVGVRDFDFMVDDGLHTFEAGSTLFTNSISKLAQHGVYVIEDVSGPDLREYDKFFGQLNYRVEFISLHRVGMALGDNSLVVIRKNGE
jgi:hypothetical protein